MTAPINPAAEDVPAEERPRAVIVHGTGGHPNINWLPWLAQELRRRNIATLVPALPTPEGQSLENWQRAFAAQVGSLTPSMVLVGHSIGCGLILRLLEQSRSAVRAAHLAAGWTGLLGNPDFDPLISSFFLRPFDWPAIRRNAGRIFLYHGDNDPYVPLPLARELAAALQSPLQVIPNGGHLNAASGYLRFDKLLADILELIR